MLSNSICADDISTMQLPKALTKFLGPFQMGGLTGFPFTGDTGLVLIRVYRMLVKDSLHY